MDTAISVRNLSKVFHGKKNDIWALDNISFNVKESQIFGLLGPNGAGKTTTIRLIAGILRPTTGNIDIFDEEVNEKSAHILRKQIGFLTENHGNYEHLTVYENLEFFGGFYNITHLDSRINTVLKQIGLFERKDMKVGKLSKGQKQRLAVARTIIHEPEVLFFDEPTSGLDPMAAVEVRDLISGLKSRERTIFINSHNLEEVQKLCDKVAILDQGKIKRIGTPAELAKELWDAQETIYILKEQVPPGTTEILERLDIIKSFRIEDNKIFVYTNNAVETTPIIIKELVNYHVNIVEVKQTVHSLEDIYIKLMEKPN